MTRLAGAGEGHDVAIAADGSILVIGLAYWLASWGAARMVGGEWTASKVATRFAHTLVPIALAYAVAHYLTLIVFEGQQLVAAVSDPFGLGWDLFGTAVQLAARQNIELFHAPRGLSRNIRLRGLSLLGAQAEKIIGRRYDWIYGFDARAEAAKAAD